MACFEGRFDVFGWLPVSSLPALRATHREGWLLKSATVEEDRAVGLVYAPGCDSPSGSAPSADLPSVQPVLHSHRTEAGHLAVVHPAFEHTVRSRMRAHRRGETWRLCEDDLWRLFVEALRGLAALHSRGTHHGAVSVSGMALRHDGSVALLDCGVRWPATSRAVADVPADVQDVCDLGDAVRQVVTSVCGSASPPWLSDDFVQLLDICSGLERDPSAAPPQPAAALMEWTPIARRLYAAHYACVKAKLGSEMDDVLSLQADIRCREAASLRREQQVTDREIEAAQAESRLSRWEAEYMVWREGLAVWHGEMQWRSRVVEAVRHSGVRVPHPPACSLRPPPLPARGPQTTSGTLVSVSESVSADGVSVAGGQWRSFGVSGCSTVSTVDSLAAELCCGV
eukprot:TRINITY_DN12429_c0_g1_i1.p1 TRINITY_DN12429_c0_g1~~TRINITY_DN12429_c0_g1_i1.p1  ORF type:complete len:416 (+),score=133.87 TRINITY_DN12429_c0_g1_i1:55-1248(+)